MPGAPPLTLHDHDANGMHELRKLLIAAYIDVYTDLLADSFFAPERYWQRLESHAK